jgi:uncharacterized protein YajQ (UPF0234 family)
MLKQGLDAENAKKIVALIKAQKQIKVTASIEKDKVKVTGKQRDDLQAVMQFLRGQELPVHLSFDNRRD